MQLPQGVDGALVSQRWQATAADWRLNLQRAELTPSAGDDGLVTLIDAVASIAPDGELRGRAVWHVINRTRSQLDLRLPPGAVLWELRRDGVVITPRDLGDARRVAVSVRPLRSGEAASRIAITWRQPGTGPHINAPLPLLEGLTVTQVVWRISGPDGRVLRLDGGHLRSTAMVAGEVLRANRVADELRRLRQQGDHLKDAALLRYNGQLAQLESELNDHLTTLHRLGGSVPMALQPATEATAQTNYSWDTRNNSNPLEIGALQGVLDAVQSQSADNRRLYNTRNSRREKLNLYSSSQIWSKSGPSAQGLTQAQDMHTQLRSADDNGVAHLRLRVQSLGLGHAPVGFASDPTRSLLGLDLLGTSCSSAVVLAGQGGEPHLRAELLSPNAPWWPWPVTAVAGLLAVSALWPRRKRVSVGFAG
jgi:hypothetical protein